MQQCIHLISDLDTASDSFFVFDLYFKTNKQTNAKKIKQQKNYNG